MSVALHGNLRDFGIAEVFQLIGQQRKTGTLVVGSGTESVWLKFDEGHVVSGGGVDDGEDGGSLGRQLVRAGHLTREQLDGVVRESMRSARPIADLLVASGRIERDELDAVRDLLTRETVFDIMRRRGGEFHFSAEAVDHDTPPDRLLGAEQILMDGLRMLDEWQTFSAAVPSEEAVFRRTGSLEASRALAHGDGSDRLGSVERVLGLVDGRLTVRRIIDLSRIGTFEATRVLAELRQAGLIEVGSEEVRRPVRRAARPVSVLPTLRAVVASAVPFVLLGALSLSALGGGAQRIAGTALPDPFSSRLGGVQERERVRQLLEVHYFEHGRYPDRLEALAEAPLVTGTSLTPARLADYYYRVDGDEVVLLAPME